MVLMMAKGICKNINSFFDEKKIQIKNSAKTGHKIMKTDIVDSTADNCF